jgi:NAD(P)-dependent dehydrogenase (short-subunit alcohol dehydrogenase family)
VNAERGAFAGKVAVITGGASGIGRALAEALARRGANLAIADTNDARLAETAAAVDAMGATVIAVHCDVTSDTDMARLHTETINRFGQVDLLCNNAGVAVVGPPEHAAIEDWQWILDINLLGIVRGVRTFVPAMVERGSGHVLNTGSVAGTWAYTWDAAPYITSKFAVYGFSEVLARRLRPAGVGVTVLCPGLITTNFAETFRLSGVPENRSADWQYLPPEMLADPKEPAEAALVALDAVEANRFAAFTHAADAEQFRTWRLDIDSSLAAAINASPAPPQL